MFFRVTFLRPEFAPKWNYKHNIHLIWRQKLRRPERLSRTLSLFFINWSTELTIIAWTNRNKMAPVHFFLSLTVLIYIVCVDFYFKWNGFEAEKTNDEISPFQFPRIQFDVPDFSPPPLSSHSYPALPLPPTLLPSTPPIPPSNSTYISSWY